MNYCLMPYDRPHKIRIPKTIDHFQEVQFLIEHGYYHSALRERIKLLERVAKLEKSIDGYVKNGRFIK